ncbi:MAG: GNAT family N-acetyltransferase [Bacillaceae bacterium]|nr:GNAT family N-acetyltransferase [Bacillaceae bacterium]
MTGTTHFQIHTLHQEDIKGLIELSASVGWDYDEAEIKTVMSAGTSYGHKNEQGQIISSAAIIPYGQKLASIGMVIVDQRYRGHGLGSALTRTCIEAVPEDITIMLIATPEGKPLYEKLGFHTVSCVHKILSEDYVPFYTHRKNGEYTLSPLTDDHLDRIVELDRSAVGANRSAFLKLRIRQADRGIVVTDRTGIAVGYGLSIKGPVNTILGPIVAINQDVATSIIDHLATNSRGKLRIDVPDEQYPILTFLEDRGFNKVSEPPVMIRNAKQLPPRNQTLYGIAAQVFG